MSDPKTHRAYVMLSASQHAELLAAMEREGVNTLADYMRQAALQRARKSN